MICLILFLYRFIYSVNYEKLAETTSKVPKISEKQKIKAETTSCIVNPHDGKLRSSYKMGY